MVVRAHTAAGLALIGCWLLAACGIGAPPGMGGTPEQVAGQTPEEAVEVSPGEAAGRTPPAPTGAVSGAPVSMDGTAVPAIATQTSLAPFAPNPTVNTEIQTSPAAQPVPPEGATPGAGAVGMPEPPALRTRYVLEAQLDYPNHTLAVQETITYANTTLVELDTLPLVIEALRYPGAFNLMGVFLEDGTRTGRYQLKESQLNLILPEKLPPGESASFGLTYTLQLPFTTKLFYIQPHPFGYTDLQANLGDWYPFVPPYQPGKGWLMHAAHFYGEHLVYDIADYEVRLRPGGDPGGLVIAAGAPAEFDGESYRYSLPAARSFAWSASPHYQVITQTAQLPSGSPVTVASYHFPFYEGAGERAAQTVAQALSLYSELYGEYPRPWLSVVQADFTDGMEYDGFFFLSKDFYNWYNGSEASFLVTLAAHETAHQWWFGLVGNDPALEPWLDEALSTYSERLFYERFYPQALDWWWTYRVEYFEPQGKIDIAIYDVPGVLGQYRPYRDAVYLNGAKFLEALRQLVGEAAFFAFLRGYVQEYAYGRGDAERFFEVLGKYSQADLGPLKQEYFKRLTPK